MDRRLLGKCVPDIQVGDVRPFPPVGECDYVLFDTPEEAGYNVLYYIFGVDAAGTREFIPWPQRQIFAYADCEGGPAVRGMVTVDPPVVNIEACPGQCWYAMSYWDSQFPPELGDLEGKVVDVYGELKQGMHGYYVDVIFWWLRPDGCGPCMSRSLRVICAQAACCSTSRERSSPSP